MPRTRLGQLLSSDVSSFGRSAASPRPPVRRAPRSGRCRAQLARRRPRPFASRLPSYLSANADPQAPKQHPPTWMKLDRRRCPARLKLVRIAASAGQHTNSRLINPLGRCPSRAQLLHSLACSGERQSPQLPGRLSSRCPAPEWPARGVRAPSTSRSGAGRRQAGDAHVPGVVRRQPQRPGRPLRHVPSCAEARGAGRAAGRARRVRTPSREPLKLTASATPGEGDARGRSSQHPEGHPPTAHRV